MSIFSAIAHAEHTFVAWFEKEVTRFENAAPAIETDIEQGVKYAVGVLKIVASQVTPGSAAAGILSTAVQDLTTLSAVTFDAGAHPSLASGFQAVVDNLSGLEKATGIKSAGTVATVGKVISTLASIAEAVLAIVPAA